jgi:hypothetical protein
VPATVAVMPASERRRRKRRRDSESFWDIIGGQ